MKLRISLAILTLCLTVPACIAPAGQLLENIEQLETPTPTVVISPTAENETK